MQQGILLEYNYIFKQSDNDSPLTLLLLHGTGGDEQDLLELGNKIDPHANILSPRGNVLEGNYNRFFERLSEGVFNEEDIKKRSKDLSEFIIEAQEKHGLQNTKIIAVGFSNGANIAASILLLHPNVLSGAILLRATLPLEPLENPHLSNKPILLLSGTHDSMTKETQVNRLVEIFTSNDASLTHHWLTTGHGLTHQDGEIASTWLTNNFKHI